MYEKLYPGVYRIIKSKDRNPFCCKPGFYDFGPHDPLENECQAVDFIMVAKFRVFSVKSRIEGIIFRVRIHRRNIRVHQHRLIKFALNQSNP